MADRIWLGIDAGSVSLKTTVLDSQGQVLFEDYRRTHGQTYQTALDALEELESRFPQDTVAGVAVTGSASGHLTRILGGQSVNEIVAQSVGLRRVCPQTPTAIEIGGQDAKLLVFDSTAGLADASLRDFSMNSLCAAGTGSFLDQQATRLGVAIEEEFGKLALESSTPPRIAGRCSVFAKSDMIHLQQVATPVPDIAMGLCLALARSFVSTVGKGKEFERPVAFLGGVASNAGMVRAFREVLELEPDELIVPPHHRTLGALGAAWRLQSHNTQTEFRGAQALREYLKTPRIHSAHNLPRLRPFLTAAGLPDNGVPLLEEQNAEKKIEAYLGIDVGSISTNVIALDADGRLLAKRYLRTASRPIEAVQEGLAEIEAEIGDRIEVRGVSTTGSGRYLIGELVGADIIRNEITAQATAAIWIDPTVDTIFEIGGQDSKYISIDQATVCDFEMNRACAAGTGSFLEEQAERLSVELKEEFSPLALDADSPVSLGDRCTVFMESDLVHHQQQGAATSNLLAGLAYSIVHNYLNRVVGERRVGDRIFFQGGTAFNKAVVAAFNQVTGKEVIVPPHHEVTGAIGAALLARQNAREARERGEAVRTRFRGFNFSQEDFKINSFVCRSCDNLCEIRRVQFEGQRPVYSGSRCEKYDVDRHSSVADHLPDLFAERHALLLGESTPAEPQKDIQVKGTVGIPMALSFYDVLPFWRAFFESLGFQILLSGATTTSVVRQGVEKVVFETCFPVKIAHGHVLELMAQSPDLIFLPSLINSENEDFGPQDAAVFNCPLVQSLPYTLRSSIDPEAQGIRVFSPVLHFQWGQQHLEQELIQHGKTLQSSKAEIRRALRLAHAAQENFYHTLEERGREILENLDPETPSVVIVARPYNGCDPGMNLDLSRKFRSLGVLPIPMEMLPLRSMRLPERWRKVYWRYGQRIMKAATLIRQNPNLFGVYVTNFSCGPDSFLLDFFRQEMSGKPYLQLEIDEHSADAGLLTRCEAFLDTLRNLDRERRKTGPTEEEAPRVYSNHRRLYIPCMSPHAHALAGAFRSMGVEAVAMDPSNEESLELGRRYTSGRECYPCLLTTGDMVRQTRRPDFNPNRSAFFMASTDGPCRFGQYHCLHRHVLDKLGLEEVPILSLEQGNEWIETTSSIGKNFERHAWQAVVCVDVLEKILLKTRPYEQNPGESDALFQESVQAVSEAIARGSDSLWETMRQLAARWKIIERRLDAPNRPRIGVVGEVYVRTNEYANNSVVRTLEQLGAEVMIPTMGEWFHYLSEIRGQEHRARGHHLKALKGLATRGVQNFDEKKAYSLFGLEPDAGPQTLFEMAKPYLDSSFYGEAILTIGKSVELIRHEGVCGVVNTMPFTCMPGSICSALFTRVRRDHHNIPVFHAAYTGQQELNLQLRLEAFVYQAKQFFEERPDRHQPEYAGR